MSTIDNETLETLAAAARPSDALQWGSDQQTKAENAFFAVAKAVCPALTGEAFETYCLKATTDEMIDEALRILRGGFLPAPPLNEYAFDVILSGALRVKAATYAEALATLKATIDCADSNLGAWPNGDPILAELSLSDKTGPALYEVNGSHVDGFGDLIGHGKRFRVYSNGSGYVILRLDDGKIATFYGDDRSEIFNDHYNGDDSEFVQPTDFEEEADDVGTWAEEGNEF